MASLQDSDTYLNTYSKIANTNHEVVLADEYLKGSNLSPPLGGTRKFRLPFISLFLPQFTVYHLKRLTQSWSRGYFIA